jgi:DNA-directed RNA polymerase subunit RPC12/RpoP
MITKIETIVYSCGYCGKPLDTDKKDIDNIPEECSVIMIIMDS